MAGYSVDCPACPASARVTVDDDVAIYRIEAFESKPRRTPFSAPTPLAALGEKLYLDRSNQQRRTTRCDDGHYLRVFAAEYIYVPQSNCLYPPKEIPQVECPFCSFRYGTHEQFVHRPDADTDDGTHVLRSVTTAPEPDHTERTAITRQACTNHDRLAVPRSCPHCGRQSYFNYRTLAIEPTVYFVGIDDA